MIFERIDILFSQIFVFFLMKDIFLFLVLFALCSCHNYTKSKTVVWNYDDFISANVRMSDIADEMTIIQPDSIDYKGAEIVHASSFFLAGTEQGILRYDKEGHFMNRIGAIGQGPGEYRRFYNMAINETDRIIYVYCMDTSALLSFSYEGTFLNKHSLQLPKEWAWKFYYLEDKFYFYYLVNADSESAPYMYAITDTIGNLLYSKLDESLHFLQGTIQVFRLIIWDCLVIPCWYGINIVIQFTVSQKKEKKLLLYGVNGVSG